MLPGFHVIYTTTTCDYRVVARDFVFDVLLLATCPDASGGNGRNWDERTEGRRHTRSGLDGGSGIFRVPLRRVLLPLLA